MYRNRLIRKSGGQAPPPEKRLSISYPGFLLAIAGLVVFCVTLADAKPLHWTIKPIIGIAVAGFGVQVVTTIVITCKLGSEEQITFIDPSLTTRRLFRLLSRKQVFLRGSGHQLHTLHLGIRKFQAPSQRQVDTNHEQIGPFWFSYMFASCGLKGSAGLMSGLILVSMIPIAFLQWRGLRQV
jgi:hypothetical protein